MKFTPEQARGFQRDVDGLVAMFLFAESARAAWTNAKVLAGENGVAVDVVEEALGNLVRDGVAERYGAVHPDLSVTPDTARAVRLKEYRA